MELTPEQIERVERAPLLASLHARARGWFGDRQAAEDELRAEAVARWGIYSAGSELNRAQLVALHDWLTGLEDEYAESQRNR